ncbi:SDR family oxidoreductase [Microcoleus sp. herbarium7]|uniref:SDR family NAD(P)-dependent oxidoreductase n=1 Tax=unclassified Microcoleus TaxID=2642155 RepID=UPI002FD699C7
MIDLTGKVILVTGGSQGIGAATVRTLVKAGADVVLHYFRSHQEAEAIAASVGGDRCYLLAADLRMENAASSLWRDAIEWRGHIDVLVNNAGIMQSAGIDDKFDVWSSAWQQTLQVNLVAVADLCREAILHFKARKAGTIINIASRAAFRGDDPNYLHYAASKGAVVALTRSIARGFAADNILAFTVAPGFVSTEMSDRFIQECGEAEIIRDIPIGKIAPPQDVANVIAFLASGLAAHATGTTIDINGASYVH